MYTKKNPRLAPSHLIALALVPAALWACAGADTEGDLSETAALTAKSEDLRAVDLDVDVDAPSLELAPEELAPALATAPRVGPITCTIQTSNGHYLTAVGAGGRTSDVLHTDATRVGSWEKFTLIDSGDGDAFIHYGLRTANGYYLTAVGGGGRISDVIHSDATQLLDWEKFTMWSLGLGVYAIRTIDGHYLTAVGAGGRITDTIHSDATNIAAWEKFTLNCTSP